ncbi:MAG: hypothetical protein OXN89_18030 [Bryobacterales bacterium]|nr:hypothetical protein [Bryobacterales bacterium]
MSCRASISYLIESLEAIGYLLALQLFQIRLGGRDALDLSDQVGPRQGQLGLALGNLQFLHCDFEMPVRQRSRLDTGGHQVELVLRQPQQAGDRCEHVLDLVSPQRVLQQGVGERLPVAALEDVTLGAGPYGRGKVVSLVTNCSLIDGSDDSGVRPILTEDFSAAWMLNKWQRLRHPLPFESLGRE